MTGHHQLPTELILRILFFCDPITTIRCESTCRRWYSISHTFESVIWFPKVAHLHTAPVKGETWKKVYRIYKSWSSASFPNLKTLNDCCLNPAEGMDFMPAIGGPRDKVLLNGQRLHAYRKLLVARVGNNGTATLPVRRNNDCQVWLDNSGHFTRGLSVPLSDHTGLKGEIIVPGDRPSGCQVQFIQQTRSSLLICQEMRRSVIGGPVHRGTIRVWDPQLRPDGPWTEDARCGNNSHGGLWVLEEQLRGAMLCGNKLVVPIGDDPRNVSSCRLYTLSSSPSGATTSVDHLWDFSLPPDHTIQELSLNESYALLKCQTPTSGPVLLLLSIHNGSLIQPLPIPPCLLTSREATFHLSTTRFHILLYNSEWLCIQDLSHHRHTRILKLPYVGKPIRLDVSEDDSIVLVAPQCQKGEIMVIDVLNSKTQTVLLGDGYAESPRAVGRRALGVWMLFMDGFVDERGNEKSPGQVRVTWKGLAT